MKNLWKDYNESLPELPTPVKALQDKMIKQCGWQKDSGPYPGVLWQGGCIWSVNWNTSFGFVKSRDYFPLEFMPGEAVIFELLDFAKAEASPTRGKGKIGDYLKLLLELREVEVTGRGRADKFMEHAKKILKGGSAEYTWPFSPPVKRDGLLYELYRPGWSRIEKPEKKIQVPEGFRVAP